MCYEMYNPKEVLLFNGVVGSGPDLSKEPNFLLGFPLVDESGLEL